MAPEPPSIQTCGGWRGRRRRGKVVLVHRIEEVFDGKIRVVRQCRMSRMYACLSPSISNWAVMRKNSSRRSWMKRVVPVGQFDHLRKTPQVDTVSTSVMMMKLSFGVELGRALEAQKGLLQPAEPPIARADPVLQFPIARQILLRRQVFGPARRPSRSRRCTRGALGKVGLGRIGRQPAVASRSARAFALRSGVGSISANQYIMPFTIEACMWGSANAGSMDSASW